MKTVLFTALSAALLVSSSANADQADQSEPVTTAECLNKGKVIFTIGIAGAGMNQDLKYCIAASSVDSASIQNLQNDAELVTD